ncbi:MAG: ankyrin repeat domain-containing protein [Cyanobacteria bacterium SZAS-4]|nr:ankyrin repeat domain-containing protein [Cyanobacteria bacterium SZAS-4]
MKDAKEQQDEDIHLAARKGDLKEIQRILSTDPSTLNANGWMGAKPLYYAAESGSLECVQFLLNNGAQVNEPSNESKTTAIFGASTAEIAKLLLENGAELNVISQRGRVPLDYAIQYGHEDVVKVLIAHGANVNYDKGPNFFSTMIQWAIEPARNSRNNEALAESDNSHRVRERIVELLLKAGADPNQTNVYKQTAINKACRFGQLGIVELLLKYGANPNLRDISGDTAFDEAKEHTEILKVLEPFRKDIPLPPRVQCTPEELVQRLLKADADNCDSYSIH